MKHLFLAACLLTTQLFSFAQTKSEETEITNLINTIQSGWNARDGKLFASAFAEDHDYIVWTGMFFPKMTMTENANAHQNIFNTMYKTTDLKLKLANLRKLRDDIAIVHMLGAAYEHGTEVPKDPGIIISTVMEKKEGKWRIVSFHNCDIEVSFDPNKQTHNGPPTSVMYAAWYK